MGTAVAGRNRLEVEPLVGFFANTLVLRNTIAARQSFRTFLRQVRTGTLEALAHQDVPFDMLVEVLAPQRQAGLHPLFQVMFTLQTAPLPHLQLGQARGTFSEPTSLAERSPPVSRG